MVEHSRGTPRFATVIFDCDSTLCAVEGIDELAGGHRVEIERLTDAAMRGELPLEAVYGRRLELIAPTRAQVDALGDLYVRTLVEGARDTVQALKAGGVHVRIISGGLLPPVRAVGVALGIPPANIAAVDIYFDARGDYAGFEVASPLARSGGKIEVIAEWRRTHPTPMMLVGDGITDAEARGTVECFVAFAGVIERGAVVEQGDVVIREPSLLPVLSLVF